MSISAIILAAGTGERFGKKKQFVKYKDKPLWQWVQQACIDSGVIEDYVILGVDIKGGKTRQESVFYGLHKVWANRVVILEAARPLVTPEQIRTIATHSGNSVSFVAPAYETILHKGKHLNRNDCEIIQVPQAFNTALLRDAHVYTCKTDATDDTVLMWDIHRISPDLIPGGRNLHKVTYPHDMKVLENIHEDLNNRG